MKRLFGLVRYHETEAGDRLSEESVKDTVHLGMSIGMVFALLIAWTVFRFMSSAVGQSIGAISVIIFLSSWILTSYMSYQTVCDKVEKAFKKHGEWYDEG